MSRLLDNRYKIIRSLAHGGFGETFLAADTRLPSERLCVVKQLKLDTADPSVQTLAKARFTREAVVLEGLGQHHDQIPQLYAYFEEGGEFYLVQAYIEGHTLTQCIKQSGPWSEPQVQTLLNQLLPVLAYIHGKGIIHRDIKPDNIILRQRDGLPVLIDFGAVKEAVKTGVIAPGQPQPSVVIGTTGFMPPEQASGHPLVGSDLYALGLTAIYCLSGRLPSEIDDNPMTGELYWQPHAPGLSPRLTAVLNQVIRPIPKDRFASAQAMQRALGGRPVTLPAAQPAPAAPVPAALQLPTLSPQAAPAVTVTTQGATTQAVSPDASHHQPTGIAPAAPSIESAAPRRTGCRWLLWPLLVIVIAATSGTLSFALKRRSILFFSNDESDEVDLALLSSDVAKAVVEDFYRHVSDQNMLKARDLVGGSLAAQLDPSSTFFQQFDRVTVERLAVTQQTDTVVDLTGVNTYYYPDGTTQQEERTFTVEQQAFDPRIVASEFVQVTQPRQ